MFPVSLDKAGPKHSTSVPVSVGVAVPLRVDVKEVAFVPNPVTGVTVNVALSPQIVGEVDVCVRGHSLLPPMHSPDGDSIPVPSNSTYEGEDITRTGGGSCNKLST